MQDSSRSVPGLSTNAVMIDWAQAEFGSTAWPIPGKRSATDLLSPGVISPTHRGAVLESNSPGQDEGGNVGVHRESIGGVGPTQTPRRRTSPEDPAASRSDPQDRIR